MKTQSRSHRRILAADCLRRVAARRICPSSYSCTRHSADAVTENGALMAAVASTSTSHPLRSAGAKGALWITDKWSQVIRVLRADRERLHSAVAPFDSQTAWLETIMPFAAAFSVTVLVRTMVVPSPPGRWARSAPLAQRVREGQPALEGPWDPLARRVREGQPARPHREAPSGQDFPAARWGLALRGSRAMSHGPCTPPPRRMTRPFGF